MRPFSGTIYVTEDKQMCYNHIVNPQWPHMVIDLDETSTDMEQMFPGSILKGTILLPPPSAVFAQIDGDAEGFGREYFGYLNSDVVVDFTDTMVYMVYAGINTLIYIPPDDDEFRPWMDLLYIHFQRNYGFVLGTPVNPFLIDYNRMSMYAYKLYRNNHIRLDDYIRMIPFEVKGVPDGIRARVAQDLFDYQKPGEMYYDAYERYRIEQLFPKQTPQQVAQKKELISFEEVKPC